MPTIEELHAFLIEVRATAYVSALQTGTMIDEFLLAHPLPVADPEPEAEAA
jgi:hypothetical protein